MKRAPKLGQHFLKHAWAARTLAHAARPEHGEMILEIGPGKGALTKELLSLGKVVAIEKDRTLAEHLRKRFANEIQGGRLTVVESDIRDIDLRRFNFRRGYVLAANIPYYLTGEIIRQFLSSKTQPRMITLLVQKEVAQRIVGRKESILSLSVKAYGSPEIIAKVSRTHFSPPPRVDSAIITITKISKQFFETITEDDFFRVVRAGFASKRKYLSNNLRAIAEAKTVRAIFEFAGIPLQSRAEDISLDQWKKIARYLTQPPQ